MKNSPGLIDDAFPFIERMDGAPAVTYTRVFMKTQDDKLTRGPATWEGQPQRQVFLWETAKGKKEVLGASILQSEGSIRYMCL
jgi:hypothetical protein